MGSSVYTLLIVESPTIARIIQKMCPPSVYVLSTDGFCWRPKYDFSSNRLKAIADPNKRSIRKELEEQSKIAGTIVVAVDSDASGDFIAWSISQFIESSNVKRGRLQSLSKHSIHSMLSETFELDESQLETRLRNRFLIQKLWNRHAEIPDIQLAGLISVFGVDNHFHSFLDEKNTLYRSSQPVLSQFDEWISVRSIQNIEQYLVEKPLSTYDIIEFIFTEGLAESGKDSQLLLNQLFQTILPFSEESLISYPRTSAQAFYSDTWNHMRRQYLKMGSINDLKPTYLQEIADNESPHESVHPIDLSLKPESVSGELSKNVGNLYQWIYQNTLHSLSMPKHPGHSFVSDLNPDVVFYPESSNGIDGTQSIRPCLTLSELGIQMDAFGVAKPSDFGKTVDGWLTKGWIQIDGRVVRPGREVLNKLDNAVSLQKKLQKLNRLKEENALRSETVLDVISS